jgi:hypothetical protein
MQIALRSAAREPRAGARVDPTIYSLLASRARAASRRALATLAVGAGLAALAAVALGVGHWTVLTGCYLVWSFAVWGLVFGPAHPKTRAWRGVEIALVSVDTLLAAALIIGLFYLALGPRWML